MFDKLIGNNQVKSNFVRLLKTGRLPNSLLLTGEDGVGKRLFALELAKSYVCRNPVGGEACDTCSACLRSDRFLIPAVDESAKVDESLRNQFKKVFWSEHPDIAIVSPLKNSIFIDAIRSLETESNFRPYEARARFFIVNEAEKMNDNAANALLKTLEEPSPTSHIILVTSRPNALLQTIRSRCQAFRFSPVEAAEIESFLLKSGKFSADDASLLSTLSAGSIGKALELNLDAFREQRETILNAVESLLSGKQRSRLLKTAEEMSDAKKKDQYAPFLNILQTVVHDIWTLSVDPDSENVVNSDIVGRLTRMSTISDRTKLASWLLMIEDLREKFSVNLNKKIATDALFMKMAA